MPRRRRWRSPRTAGSSSREPLRGRTFRLEILRAAFPAGASGVAAPAARRRDPRDHGRGRADRARAARAAASGAAAATSRARSGRRGLRHARRRDDRRPRRGAPAAPALVRRGGGPARGGGALHHAARHALAPTSCACARPPRTRRRPRPPSPGRVLDPGSAKRDGRTGVRLDVREPAWLVLVRVLQRRLAGALRRPRPRRARARRRLRDGLARAGGLPRAEMAFAPDSLVRAGYLVSLPVLLALLGLVLVFGARRAGAAPDELPEPPGRAPARAGRRPRCSRSSRARCSASCSRPAPRR